MVLVISNKGTRAVGGKRKGPKLEFLNVFKICVSVKTRLDILTPPVFVFDCIGLFLLLPVARERGVNYGG